MYSGDDIKTIRYEQSNTCFNCVMARKLIKLNNIYALAKVPIRRAMP